MFIENLNLLKYVDMKPGGGGGGWAGGGVVNKVLCMYVYGEAPPQGVRVRVAVNAPDYKTFVFFSKSV